MLFKNKKESFVVYTAGAAVLKEIAKPVPVVTAEIRQLASEMIKTMRVFNGIGLAAPQYGHSLRLVVFDVPREGSTGTPGEEYLLPKMPMAVINRSLHNNPETVFLPTKPEHSHISSSYVRELLKHGEDVSAYLPEGVYNYIKSK